MLASHIAQSLKPYFAGFEGMYYQNRHLSLKKTSYLSTVKWSPGVQALRKLESRSSKTSLLMAEICQQIYSSFVNSLYHLKQSKDHTDNYLRLLVY